MSREGRRVFPDMTVKDNLEMGAYTRNDKDEIERDFDHVYELFPVLKERSNRPRWDTLRWRTADVSNRTSAIIQPSSIDV